MMRIHARVNGTILSLPDIKVQVLVGIHVKLDTVEMFSKEKENYVCPKHDRNFAAYCLLVFMIADLTTYGCIPPELRTRQRT